MQLIVTSLEGLSELPRQKQFIDSLTEFQRCMRETNTLVEKIMQMGRFNRVIWAKTNENKIDACKQRFIDFIPVLNLGLNAQQLMDRARDREDAMADREVLMVQKEQVKI